MPFVEYQKSKESLFPIWFKAHAAAFCLFYWKEEGSRNAWWQQQKQKHPLQPIRQPCWSKTKKFQKAQQIQKQNEKEEEEGKMKFFIQAFVVKPTKVLKRRFSFCFFLFFFFFLLYLNAYSHRLLIANGKETTTAVTNIVCGLVLISHLC